MKYYSKNLMSANISNLIKKYNQTNIFWCCQSKYDQIEMIRGLKSCCVIFNHKDDSNVFINFYKNGNYYSKKYSAHNAVFKNNNSFSYKYYYINNKSFTNFKSNKEWRQYIKLLAFT